MPAGPGAALSDEFMMVIGGTAGGVATLAGAATAIISPRVFNRFSQFFANQVKDCDKESWKALAYKIAAWSAICVGGLIGTGGAVLSGIGLGVLSGSLLIPVHSACWAIMPFQVHMVLFTIIPVIIGVATSILFERDVLKQVVEQSLKLANIKIHFEFKIQSNASN